MMTKDEVRAAIHAAVEGFLSVSDEDDFWNLSEEDLNQWLIDSLSNMPGGQRPPDAAGVREVL